ncbi:DUF2849 domain-containing protein [Propylenella binzhouense]|uniref:DUF2849 domain-containing protein n=1 Tax=Propylenella binzhouense TaxID=2555902 RepID=A0A964T9Q1_9HYPH|nr:DUF2849 domain-containing protein [Propylenella binzhouense]MYZ50477.1 DUF2849 domain-containing protein [Propylenella binzhouense]
MPKPVLRVVTANRLADGRVVFLAGAGWTRAIGAASLLSDPQAEAAALARAEADAAADRVVDVYAVEVVREAAEIVPVRLRERIRLTGPTAGNSVAPSAPRAS